VGYPSHAKRAAERIIARIRANEKHAENGGMRSVHYRVNVNGNALDLIANELPGYVHHNSEGRVCFMGVPVRIT
jgi:hypothetical protein